MADFVEDEQQQQQVLGIDESEGHNNTNNMAPTGNPIHRSSSRPQLDVSKAEIQSNVEDKYPTILLPNQSDDLSHLALDIGGSLIKLVYFSRHEGQSDDDKRKKTLKERLGLSNGNRRSFPILGGRLHFVKFETGKINECLDFIHSKQLHRGLESRYSDTEADRNAIIKATGGGAYKFTDLFKEKLGVSLDKEDEMNCLVAGANFLLKAIRHEAFTHMEGQKEFVQIDQNDLFPYLLVNVGSVDIQGCPQLQFILPFLSAGDLLLLEVIIIDCCQKLEYIFGKQQDVKLASLKEMVIGNSPNFIDIFPESSQSSPSSKGSSNSISKPQTKVEPDKSNKIPLISEDQPNDRPISLESMSYSLNMWERGQCLSRLSHILSNIKVISLVNLSKIKSVFILSTAPIMSLESLTIKNCDELEHIIVDIGDGNGGNNSGNNVFPRLKELNIRKCEKLEYIFGHIDDHQNENDVIHLPLPTLECLQLCGLPSLIGICTKNYPTTFPPLKVLELVDCPQVDIETVGDFTVPYSISTSLDITNIKDLSGNVVEHFQSLEKVKVNNSKVDSIFCLNEVSERQMNLGLQNIELHNLPIMTCLFVGPKNSFVLKNLKRIKIVRCEKLEIVFSTSISSCLPQLLDLRIEDCEELRHIIKDDFENQRMSKNLSSNICFPNLQALAVENCNKLKCVFPNSICKELPELEVLLIREAYELEVVFKSEGDDQKIEIPNLKFLAFVNLPNLSHIQGIQFQAVKNRFIQNCQKLSLTSSTHISIDDIFNTDDIDHETRGNMFGLFQQLREEAKDQELTSSQELLNKQSTSRQILMDQQHSLEDDATVELPQEYGDGQIAIPSLSISTGEPVTIEDVNLEDSKKTTQINNQVSLIDDASMKANSNIMEQLPKDEEILVSKSKIYSASQFPSMYSKGDTSQTIDDLISLLVMRELEQLVSKKHLDYANLSLLTDFLVKHPSVLLRDNSLSNRYKGYAYNCLAELLKFLQIHSVLDVLGSSHSEFVELVQDVRKFSFDKHWLDGVERRASFPDLQFSQDALQKLLDSKQQVTKAVEEMRSKIKKINQHVEGLQHKLTSTEAVLESIVQQETKIRETKVALSAPLGF